MPRKKRRSIQLKDARQAKQSCTGLDENRSQSEEENDADFDGNQDDEIVLHEMNITPQRTESWEEHSSENRPQIEPEVSESESRLEEEKANI